MTCFVWAGAFALFASAPAAGAEIDGLSEDDRAALEFEGFETTVHGEVLRATPESASSVSFDADDLATASVRTAEDAIRLVPGFVLVQHGSEGKGYQFFVRGFDALHGADIETRIAGVPFNEWSNVHATGYLDLSLVPPEIVSNVDVTKGPFSVGQGLFAVAGSLGYELGVSDRNRGARAWYTAGTTNRHRLLVSYSPENAQDGSFATAEVLSDAGFGEGRAARRAGVSGRTELMSGAAGTLELLAVAGVSRFDLPGIVRLDDVSSGRIELRDSYGDDQWAGESRRGFATLIFRRRRDEVTSRAQLYAMGRFLSLTENFTGFLQDSARGDAFEQRHRSTLVGLELEQLRDFAPAWTLVFNGSARGEWIDQSEDQIDANGAVFAQSRSVEGVQAAWHGGSAVRFSPNRMFRLDVGARVDGVTVTRAENTLTGAEGD
ncbi:MAG: TonB-dependent receptor, partial [Myxococcota bacterium]